MAYIGNNVPANFQAPPAVVRFNGDGSDTTFALGRTVGSVQEILVSVDGVVQDSAAYTVPDTALTSKIGFSDISVFEPIGSLPSLELMMSNQSRILGPLVA